MIQRCRLNGKKLLISLPTFYLPDERIMAGDVDRQGFSRIYG
jgi:hypothetical protein